MSNKKVYIRVDGDAQIGLGHLVRCQALAHMLKSDFDVHFYCKLIPEKIKESIVADGFAFESIRSDADFFDLLTGSEIVVLDNYFFDTLYQKRIKDKGCKLVCIDDIHDKEFYADLIINHAPGVKASDYKVQLYTQFALGLEYALLRPEFLAAAKQELTTKTVESILICFGGSDAQNLTLACLNQIRAYSKFKAIYVVTGASYGSIEALNKVVLIDDRIHLHHNISAGKFVNLMMHVDIAIVPASGVLYETLAAGCKVISGMYVDNQEKVLKGFSDLGCIVNAGNFREDEIEKALKTPFEGPKYKVVDGKSKERILNLFLNLFEAYNLRSALPSDVDLYYRWVNDEEVRMNSINQEIITYHDHCSWFYSKLTNNESLLYVLECNNKPIGQIRFDKEKDYWLIGYSIDREYRGRGLGTEILRQGILKSDKTRFKAIVKRNNIGSLKVFKKHAFVTKDSNDPQLVDLKFERITFCIASEHSWNKRLVVDLQKLYPLHKWILIDQKDQLEYELLKILEPKLIFIPHWSHIIPEKIYSNYECIVFHMTDLPFGRGGSPLQNLIVRGYKETVISALRVAQGIDTGDIYLKKTLTLDGSAQDIFERASTTIFTMIQEIIDQNMKPTPQIGEVVTFKRRTPEMSNIGELDTLTTIYDYIRMLDADGYPHAYIETNSIKFEFTDAKLGEDKIIANVRITKK